MASIHTKEIITYIDNTVKIFTYMFAHSMNIYIQYYLYSGVPHIIL